ncbi:MAG: S41 family peptidase [Armatimonadota bacterium]|nr:S41 family peptidase [Armatimonadota bacterium]
MKLLMRHSYRAIGIFLLVLAILAASVTPLASQASDAELVLQALTVLREHYVDPLDPITLLNAAIGGIRRVLSGAGLPVDSLAALPPGLPEGEARQVFLATFTTASTQYQGPARELAYAAIRAMTESLHDSHTAFLGPEQYQERLRQQRGEPAFSGVGIILMERGGKFYVREVIPGGPAEGAGVRPLDRIVMVNGRPTSGMTISQISTLIRGPTGTTVILSIQRAGVPEPLVIPITRSPIRLPAVRAERIEQGILYLRIYGFNPGTAAQIQDAIYRLGGLQDEAMILDLRGNPGGFLNELTRVAELFLPRGTPIYQMREREMPAVTVRTRSVPLIPPWTRVSVLIDEGSASAAELLSAAFQESGRGTLVGTKTAGAVEASILIRLSDGSALSVTVARMYTGLGKRLEGEGVTPDIPVDLSDADLDAGRDSQLEAAIRIALPTPAEVTLPHRAPQLVFQF